MQIALCNSNDEKNIIAVAEDAHEVHRIGINCQKVRKKKFKNPKRKVPNQKVKLKAPTHQINGQQLSHS